MAQRPRSERRRKKRVQLPHAIICRFGTMAAVILDITDAGARLEHFTRLDLGKKARLRFAWTGRTIDVEATVMSCRVHRFAHGDDGNTIYQSGLSFSSVDDASLALLRDLVATVVARSLAEQVANARGIGPVTERNMPVFRSGEVVTGIADRGYVKCTLIDGLRWEKKWSRTPDQPVDGFTVLATEPSDHVDQLCESYRQSDAEQRRLIKMIAQISVESPQETPEPK
jgi:hypothetical protein